MNSIHIRFKSRPSWSILSALKAAGFKWDGTRWEAPETERTNAAAKRAKSLVPSAVVTVADAMAWDLDYALGY